MNDPSSAPPAVSGRGWLLIVSLGLNLLVAGAVAGAFFSHPHRGGWPPGRGGAVYDAANLGRALAGEHGFRAYLETLPAGRRAALKPLVEQSQQTIRPLRQAAQRLRVEAVAVTAAEPFDPAKVEKAFGDLTDAEGAVHRAVAQAYARIMAALTPEERAQFAAWRKAHDALPPAPPAPSAPR